MADKISTTITYVTSVSLVCMGSVVRWLLSLDWNLISVVGGLLIGILTFWVNLHFKRRHQKTFERQTAAYEEALKRGYITPPVKTIKTGKGGKWQK